MRLSSLFVVGFLVPMTAFSADSPAGGDFEADVRPLLERHCFQCHGPEKQKADLRLDTLSTDLIGDRSAGETWHDVRNALHLGEMPPEDEPELASAEREVLTSWIDGAIERARDSLKSTGGNVVVRRLNRTEYRNTLRDLIGIEANYGANLPPDTPSEDGFRNDGASLSMSPLQLEYYLETAREALAHAIVTGPEPKVYRYLVTETHQDKGRGHWTNRLGASGQFVARLPEFPEEGEFVVRVRARAELVEGKGFPRLAARFGFRADTQAPARELGVVDVSGEEIQEFVFRGRLEQFPLQSRTQSKYPGQLIWLSNAYDDGVDRKLSRQVETVVMVKGKKQKKKTTEWIEHEDFPRIVIESVAFEGPIFDAWPPAHHRNLLPPAASPDQPETDRIREVLSGFLPRAFRRPVAPEEIDLMLTFFQRVRPTVETFEEAVRETLAMALIAPDFLYLVEPEPGEDRTPLSPFELASRLSYFLWSTMPDERLFERAAEGTLAEPETLATEIDRLLADPRSEAFEEQFATQWLDLDAIDRVAVNPEYYPDWDDDLKPWMAAETRQFFAEVLRNDLTALNFLDSDFVMLNEPMARHYGLAEGPRGSTFERVRLDPGDPRGGFLTQASVLLGNSTGEDSHPILRAVWVRDRLLDDPPADPPPNVPALETGNPDFAKLPVRLQLEAHRKDPACNDCHRGIDPWGVAMERFDAIGLPRDVIRRKLPGKKGFLDQPVESDAELPGGHRIDGMEALKRYLVENRKDQFARSLVKRLTTYAVGRSLELGDQQELEELAERFAQEGYRLRPLIHGIVASEIFQTK